MTQIGTSLRAKRCAKVQRQARHPRPVAVVVVDLHPQVVAPIGVGMPRVVVAVAPEAAAIHWQQQSRLPLVAVFRLLASRANQS